MKCLGLETIQRKDFFELLAFFLVSLSAFPEKKTEFGKYFSSKSERTHGQEECVKTSKAKG